MADKTGIEWTDATWNPIRGCTRVSEGCRNCYAEAVAARFSGSGQPYEGLAERTAKGARWTGKIAIAPDTTFTAPLRWKRPRRIFVNSMSDLFHPAVPAAVIDRVFAIAALAPQHIFQVLTKRQDRMHEYFRDIGGTTRAEWVFAAMARELNTNRLKFPKWPLPNVWLGVSVENQAAADERIPHLLDTPAAVRFLSCEPQLGPVDLSPWLMALDRNKAGLFDDPLAAFLLQDAMWQGNASGPTMLHWVIAGGESGPGARPMHPDWARSLRDQCGAAGVPFFFKQWGEWLPHDQAGDLMPGANLDRCRDEGGFWRAGKKAAGSLLDGRQHLEFPR